MMMRFPRSTLHDSYRGYLEQAYEAEVGGAAANQHRFHAQYQEHHTGANLGPDTAYGHSHSVEEAFNSAPQFGGVDDAWAGVPESVVASTGPGGPHVGG